MLIKILFKIIIVYILVMILLKLMGKREIGQVSLFDFAIILIISDILVIGVEQDFKLFSFYIIGVIFLALLQLLISFIILKNRNIRSLFDGKESVIIYDGNINIKEMKKQRYNMDDLIIQIRLNGISSISEIKYLIIENNGKVSIYLKKDNPINPLPLIVSGQIEHNNLRLLKLSEKWLKDKLETRNILIKDVYYANYEDNDLFIISSKDIKQ
jgi:uncharacterized membrane protein YcaP (DUF421 family)